MLRVLNSRVSSILITLVSGVLLLYFSDSHSSNQAFGMLLIGTAMGASATYEPN